MRVRSARQCQSYPSYVLRLFVSGVDIPIVMGPGVETRVRGEVKRKGVMVKLVVFKSCEARMVLPVQRGAWDEMLQETTKLFFSLLSKPNCNSPLPCYGIMLVTSKGDKGKKLWVDSW